LAETSTVAAQNGSASSKVNPNQLNKIQIKFKSKRIILAILIWNDGIIESEGVLEMMADGYEFLRSQL
jgi:transcription termination factor Rho